MNKHIGRFHPKQAAELGLAGAPETYKEERDGEVGELGPKRLRMVSARGDPFIY